MCVAGERAGGLRHLDEQAPSLPHGNSSLLPSPTAGRPPRRRIWAEPRRARRRRGSERLRARWAMTVKGGCGGARRRSVLAPGDGGAMGDGGKGRSRRSSSSVRPGSVRRRRSGRRRRGARLSEAMTEVAPGSFEKEVASGNSTWRVGRGTERRALGMASVCAPRKPTRADQYFGKHVNLVHILTKGILNLGVSLGFYLPVWMVDKVVLLLCYLEFGDTSKHGIPRPAIGPFARTQQTSVLPVIDVGTYNKIKSGEIQVIPAGLKSVHGNVVEFADGRQYPFDAIVFATGYKSAIKRWLQDGHDLISDNGILKQRSPKAENGLYYAGLSGRGIFGSATDAEFIAADISKQLFPQAQGKPEH